MADNGADPRLLAGVDALLGEGRDGAHPTGAELVDLAAGELQPERAAQLERHLAGCSRCARSLVAARAGLAELRRLDDAPEGRHLPLPIPMPARPRAQAAGGGGEAAPAPTDRRVLLDDGAGSRLVYFRQGGRGQVGVFGAGEARLTLDGKALAPAEEQKEAVIFDLGPVGRLPGATLEVERGEVRYSFTVVEDDAEDDAEEEPGE